MPQLGEMNNMKMKHLSPIGDSMKRVVLVAVAMLIGIVTSVPANAACTLNPDPALNLTGTWAFQVSGALTSDIIQKIVLLNLKYVSFGLGFSTIPGGGAIAGTFTVTGAPVRRGDPGGGLAIIAS